MAAEGWVRVPAAHAKAGPGFELQNLWGMRSGGQRFEKAQEELRYQMPDGSLRMRDTNGKGVSQNRVRFDFPLWSPPAPAAQPPAAPVLPPPAQPPAAAPAAQPPARPAAQPPARPAAQPPARPAAQPPARPAAAPVVAASPAAPVVAAAPGEASLNNASAVISGLQSSFGTTPQVAEDANFSVSDHAQHTATAANLGGGGGSSKAAVMGDDELNARRRAAFLNGSDSMSGLKAVRGLLSEQAAARGADISGGGSIPSIKFLEAQLAKHPVKAQTTKVADLSQGDQAVWKKMAFDNQPITQVIQGAGGAVNEAPATGTPALEGGGLSPSQIAQSGFQAKEQVVPSGAPRAAVNGYMQTALKGKLQASQQPLDQIAQWQLTPQPIQAPRVDPGREAMLAAFAARGEKPPTTEGEAVLAAGAGNPFGTRGGQFKPGNTVNLGFFDASQLPPLNSSGHYSGAKFSSNPGNLF